MFARSLFRYNMLPSGKNTMPQIFFNPSARVLADGFGVSGLGKHRQ